MYLVLLTCLMSQCCKTEMILNLVIPYLRSVTHKWRHNTFSQTVFVLQHSIPEKGYMYMQYKICYLKR